MILNKTPIRTSENYGMNNIQLEDAKIPNKIAKFDGLKISGEIDKFEITDIPSKKALKYGNGTILEEQIYNFANKEIKISDIKSGNLDLEFKFDNKNQELVENIEILANTKSKTTIVIKYFSNNDKKCYHNGIIRLKAIKDTKIDVVVVNMLNDKSINLLSIENELEEDSTVNYTIVDFGGRTSITNYYSSIKKDRAKSNLNSIYLGKGSQVFDLNYIAELFGKESKANIEVQGALKDTAIKNFKGTIDFKKGCKKAIGSENEYCVLLSDKAKSKALPMLLCTEEDVEGSHSTAAGKPEEDSLFYIMSRGISKKDAMKLIVKANFNNILKNIKDEGLKEYISNEIDKRLD